ncbi:MAG: RNA-binding transcriptional accessory protein [Candidatus Saccharibacteria bacterium]|nr:RNA-binding transcriptional accessory protein [Moraxellaceae bacterium]
MTAPDNLLAENQAPNTIQNETDTLQTENVQEAALEIAHEQTSEAIAETATTDKAVVVISTAVPAAPKLRLKSDAELIAQIAKELSVRPEQVAAAVALLDEGSTVPFIARYRKEAHGLDDAQLRELDLRLNYLRELDERRSKIIESIRGQGKLTDTLHERLNQADSKNALEDLYLPYRPKRTSKAQLAKDAGLELLALRVLNEEIDPATALECFSHERYPDLDSQLDAVSHILVDQWATDLELMENLRRRFAAEAQIVSRLAGEDKREVGKKFRDYFESQESLSKIASHRLLALLRGRQENVLTLKVDGTNDAHVQAIKDKFSVSAAQPESRQALLAQTAELLWLGKLRPHFEHSLLTEKRLAAEAEAVSVFAENMRHLLLSAPAGGKITLGMDPGIRTGVKLAVVNASGDVLAHSVIYPFAPRNERDASLATLNKLCREHGVELIAIGNGTASRETDALVSELFKAQPDLSITKVVVSEAGASVYSASELATAELPDLDVTIRGAVSIARRLQDPLAELVKIDPKSIGVGQYQHDVNQPTLARRLDAVVEDSVNSVGVDVNTASPALLARIAGLNKNIAQQIADYRRENGAFATRDDLKKVPRLGAKTFEQAAGFLRVTNGTQPLDASAVHPEAYPLVEKILASLSRSLDDVLGKSGGLDGFDPTSVVDGKFGLPTVQDVIRELEKPGRDPRPEFKTVKFRDDVTETKDLVEGMILEGVITNVTNFGAFVDIGVHQDGLVHISELSDQYVDDPHKFAKPGQIVTVRVMGTESERKRISLSLRLTPTERPAKAERPERAERTERSEQRPARTGDAPKRNNDRPRTDRPRSDKPRDDQRPRNDKPREEKPKEEKVGSFGALLAQAGIKGSK